MVSTVNGQPNESLGGQPKEEDQELSLDQIAAMVDYCPAAEGIPIVESTSVEEESISEDEESTVDIDTTKTERRLHETQ